MSSKHSQSEGSDLRVVLLGKTGVGKSASGNAILGRKAFSAKLSAASVTNECKTEKREFDGQTLAVVETPGLFNTKKEKNELVKEILDCVLTIKPGPHVLLLVLKLGATEENKKVLQIFQNVFTGAADHTIVLFTHGGDSKVDDKDKELIDPYCVNHHVFVGGAQDKTVSELLEKIKEVVHKNGGGCYTNEMFEKAEEAFKEAMKVKSEMKTDDDVKTHFMNLISKGLEAVEKFIPKWEKDFLKYLQDLALKCMPPESY